MKRMKLFAISLFAACLAASASAGVLIGGFALTTIITQQTNSPSFATNTAYVYIPQITVTNDVLSIPGAFTGMFRFSLDGGNTFFTNSSPVWTNTYTSATNTVFPAQSAAVPIIIQMLAITNVANTAAIKLGVTSP